MNNIQFMHYRAFNENMGWGDSDEISSRGGATVAILPADNNKVLVSIARCNPGDVFNKKVGRTIAAGRLQAYLNGREKLADKIVEVVITNPLQLKETVAEAIAEEMDMLGLY